MSYFIQTATLKLYICKLKHYYKIVYFGTDSFSTLYPGVLSNFIIIRDLVCPMKESSDTNSILYKQ